MDHACSSRAPPLTPLELARWSSLTRDEHASLVRVVHGRLDANILIRSAVVSGGRVAFHTGGGIVADSDPDREYEETLHKAEGMKLALEAVLDGRG